MYPCVCPTVAGFIQQLAVSYIAHGYWFYVTGHVPEGKDPVAVDGKLIDRYDIAMSKWARARRKQTGRASLQYLRHESFFVILATHGEHPFFELESKSIRDARHVPVKYAGYSVSFRGGHAHVRIEQGELNRLRAYFLDLAKHRNAEDVAAALARIPFEPYAPVRRQLYELRKAVNRARRESGYSLVPPEALRLRRRIVRPFEGVDERIEEDCPFSGVQDSEALGAFW